MQILPSMADTIRQGEKNWHEQLFRARQDRDPRVPGPIRRRYLRPPRRPLYDRELMFRLCGDVAGKRVLVFGCGDDNSTILLALMGAEVFAFDLSAEAIEFQRRMAVANNVANRLHLAVCAAEELPFAARSFDLVFGCAILHHIPHHLPGLPPSLARVLRPGGAALFTEPVLRSALLKTILDALPGHQEISPGERQLTDDDLLSFTSDFHVEAYPFCFLSRLDRFVLRGPLETAPAWQRAAVHAFHAVDYALLRTPGLHRLAGAMVIHMRRKAEAAAAPFVTRAA